MFIITELSRLDKSTSEVIDLVNQLITKQVRLVAIKQALDIKRSMTCLPKLW